MSSRLIIDGNAVYEIDEDCITRKQGKNQNTKGGGQRRCSRQEETRKKTKS